MRTAAPLLLFSALAVAQGAPQSVDGKALFEKKCSVCHASETDERPGVRSFHARSATLAWNWFDKTKTAARMTTAYARAHPRSACQPVLRARPPSSANDGTSWT